MNGMFTDYANSSPPKNHQDYLDDQRRRMRAQDRQRAGQLAHERKQAQELETSVGPIWDAMPQGDRDQYAAKHLDGLMYELFKRNPGSSLVREAVLELLHRDQVNGAASSNTR